MNIVLYHLSDHELRFNILQRPLWACYNVCFTLSLISLFIQRVLTVNLTFVLNERVHLLTLLIHSDQ